MPTGCDWMSNSESSWRNEQKGGAVSISFSLVDEPWIPCLTVRGGPAEMLGLGAVLTRPREIREIADDSPLVTVALHRLLLAILHRNFGPASTPDWIAL